MLCYSLNFNNEDELERLWGDIAYLTRYGNSDVNSVLSLEKKDRINYLVALSEIVSKENKK